MSNALVPQGHFPQQGQVDWVSLGSQVVGFSLSVLARLSKAGIDVNTVCMGRALCRRITLGIEGEKRVLAIWSRLSSIPSFEKIIWFGFGVRPIVQELATTEEGLACAAICSALLVSYDSFHAAAVLRELARQQSAPDNFCPSLSQWQALLSTCAGSITDSKFPRLVEGLARLLDTRNNQNNSDPEPKGFFRLRKPTHPSALAKALVAIGDIASGQLVGCTFQGGIDCAWIAAVAEFLYDLHVEVRDCNSSETLYRSLADIRGPERPSQVVILCHGESLTGSLTFSKVQLLPDGGALVPEIQDRDEGFMRCVEWPNLFADAFGQHFSILSHNKNANIFASLIGCTLSYLLGFRILPSAGNLRALLGKLAPFPNEQKLAQDALDRLPELKAFIDMDFNRDRAWLWSAEVIFFEECQHLRERCKCTLHTSEDRFDAQPYCIYVIAITATALFLAIFGVTFHSSILLTHWGLQRLAGVVRMRAYEDEKSMDNPRLKKLDDLLMSRQYFLATALGGTVKPLEDAADNRDGTRISAFSSNGICAFYQEFQNPCKPFRRAEDMVVMPGHIIHNTTQFDVLRDSCNDFTFDRYGRSAADVRGPVNLIVQETRDPAILHVDYLVQLQDKCFNVGIVRVADFGKRVSRIMCPGHHGVHGATLTVLERSTHIRGWDSHRFEISRREISDQSQLSSSCLPHRGNGLTLLTWSWGPRENKDSAGPVQAATRDIILSLETSKFEDFEGWADLGMMDLVAGSVLSLYLQFVSIDQPVAVNHCLTGMSDCSLCILCLALDCTKNAGELSLAEVTTSMEHVDFKVRAATPSNN